MTYILLTEFGLVFPQKGKQKIDFSFILQVSYLCVCRLMLWAPFVNFRKFPRDPTMKYPWSKPKEGTPLFKDRYPPIDSYKPWYLYSSDGTSSRARSKRFLYLNLCKNNTVSQSNNTRASTWERYSGDSTLESLYLPRYLTHRKGKNHACVFFLYKYAQASKHILCLTKDYT